MKRSNIYKFYYFLASLDLLTIVATLTIAFGIHQVYENSFEQNETWISRIDLFEQVTNLIIGANGPGNDVFESLDYEKEKHRFDDISLRLNKKLSEIEIDITENVKDSQILKGIFTIRQSLKVGKVYTYKIFTLIEENNIGDAGKNMSRMDTQFHQALVKISEVKERVRELQKAALLEYHREASDLFQKEIYVGLFVFAIIALILIYGQKLKEKIEASESEIEKRNAELSDYKQALNEHSIVARTDKHGIITYANKKFCDISGYSKEELVGNTHRIVNSGHHPSTFFEEMWKTIQNGKNWRGQIKNRAKNGDFYWVDTSITPIFDEKGNIAEFFAFRTEITNEKELEELSNDIQSIAKIGGWELDVATGETKWTDETYRIHQIPLGTPTNTINGINFYAPHERERITSYVMACIEKGVSFDDEFEFIASDGTKKWVRSIGKPVIGKNNEVVRIIATFQDISEEIQMKMELEEQRRVANHNSRLASIGELAAGVGHEINNPLTIIKGFVAKIERDYKKNLTIEYEDLEKNLTKISNASNRIAKIVQGLRTFSRADSAEVKTFDPVAAIEESISLVQEIYLKDGVTIHFNHHGYTKGSHVKANSGSIQQVFMNLLSNAKDALKGRAEQVIDINLYNDSNSLVFEFCDKGSGIPPDIINRIFDPFFTTKEVNAGTGIGLSIAHSIVLEANGTLIVESEVGVGTKFTLTLPVSKVAPSTHRNQTAPVENLYEVEGFHVLVVDDEVGVREVIQYNLEFMGIRCTMAENGQVAYDTYIQNPDQYDLILTDMKMPIIDGERLVKMIRGNDTLQQPEIMLLTGGTNIDFEDKSNPLNHLVDGYIYKPFEDDELRKSVLALVEKCKSSKKVA